MASVAPAPDARRAAAITLDLRISPSLRQKNPAVLKQRGLSTSDQGQDGLYFNDSPSQEKYSPSVPAMRVDNFRPDRKGSKLATFDLVMPSGMILRGCALMDSGGKKWVGLPSRPFKKSDGSDAWFQIVDFASRAAKDRFTAIALAAAMEAYDA
jgi:hypothetical protein